MMLQQNLPMTQTTNNGSPTNVTIVEGLDLNYKAQLKALTAPTLADFDQYRITEATAISDPVPVIKINYETISTEGNLTTISGASKSGKSAFTGWIIAGAISRDGRINDSLEGLTVEPNFYGKAVLHFDTEQAKHKHQKNVRSNLKRAGLEKCPDYFLSYNIRQLDLSTYTEVTTSICFAADKAFGGIHLIVVDGIADYIADVNDPIASNAIVKTFEELAITYSCPIVVIVHTNPGNDKERGHLGSQCQRKSESVLTIKSEGDVSYLEPKLLRMAGKGDIPLLQYRYDKEKGYHVPCGIRVKDDASKDIDRIAKLKELAQEVFAPPTALLYDEAINKVARYSNKCLRLAKDFFKEMKAHEFITQGEDKHWRIAD